MAAKAYVMFTGHPPKVRVDPNMFSIDSSLFISEKMTAGVYWISLLNDQITAPLSVEVS